MSGRPGRRACKRKRKPSLCSMLLTVRSGSVFLPRIELIIRLRTSGLIFSPICFLGLW